MGFGAVDGCVTVGFGGRAAVAGEGEKECEAGFPFALFGVAGSRDWVEADAPCSDWDGDVE
jgi:hypothetical protein